MPEHFSGTKRKNYPLRPNFIKPKKPLAFELAGDGLLSADAPLLESAPPCFAREDS